MKMVVKNVKKFKECITITSRLINETRIKTNNEGLSLLAIDPANVAMIELVMSRDCFEEISGEEEFCVNTNNLKQVLRRVKNSDVLSMETVKNKLTITINRGGNSKKFELPLIEVSDEHLKKPSLTFKANMTTYSDVFKEAVEDVNLMGESVKFVYETGKLTISSGEQLSKAKVEIKNENEEENNEGIIVSRYSAEYLKNMVEGSKISDKVRLGFNKDYPLRLVYEDEGTRLSFVLAPRVEND